MYAKRRTELNVAVDLPPTTTEIESHGGGGVQKNACGLWPLEE
jgi:hypothetical protein